MLLMNILIIGVILTAIVCLWPMVLQVRKETKEMIDARVMEDYYQARYWINQGGDADYIIDEFEAKWKDHICTGKLHLYIGKLIEADYLQRLDRAGRSVI